MGLMELNQSLVLAISAQSKKVLSKNGGLNLIHSIKGEEALRLDFVCANCGSSRNLFFKVAETQTCLKAGLKARP